MANFESQESVFNMALSYLERIDKLLYMCQESAIKQDTFGWLSYLRAVYRELSVKLDEKENEDMLKRFSEIIVVMNNPELNRKSNPELLFRLDQLDVHIRSKLQLKGMLLPSRSDPRYAVLNR